MKPLSAQNQAGAPQSERFRLVLSDMNNYVQCMLATQANHVVHENKLVRNCIVRVKQYQANATRTSAANTVVLGISVDSTWANRAFREQLGADFPILSDFRREAAKAYGVLNDASGVARRSTFVIDPDGVVQHVDVDRAALDPNAAIGACERVSKR